jgi:hypothetical protein
MRWIVKNHRCAVLLSGLTVALISAFWLWYAHTHPNLRTKVSYIRPGMTFEQVHEIIGCPPGAYRAEPARIICYQGPRYHEWLFEDGDVKVTYQPDFRIGKQLSSQVFFREPGAEWQQAAPRLFDSLTARLGF